MRFAATILTLLGLFFVTHSEVFAQNTALNPQELMPVEQQIRELEFQIDGGLSASAPDPVVYANLKEQLSALYAQREVRGDRNPLDQGTDTCPGAPLSGMPIVVTGTTTGYADNHAPYSPCGLTSAPDVVYSFVPSHTLSYTITTEGSSYDTYLYIIGGGPCPGNAQVGGDDDSGPGTTSLITLTLTGGTPYYIYVDGYSSSSGDYVLTIHDNCEILCQPNDVIECAETRAPGHEINDCNGGCSVPSQAVQTILPFQTVCGRTFNYLDGNGESQRDVDAYRITFSEACSVKLTLTSEVRLYAILVTDNCPWSIIWQAPLLQNPCSTTTYISPLIQPGTYNLWIAPPGFTGINDYREYRFKAEPLPESGCTVDGGVITGPGVYTGNNCGPFVDCGGWDSYKDTWALVVPQTAYWNISLCGGPVNWDSYLQIEYSCCSNTIVSDNDGCGQQLGLSSLGCVGFPPGVYYLTVTNGFIYDCGDYTLNITECTGSCCYGNPTSPSCQTTTISECEVLNGHFTVGEPCSTGACASRPGCANLSMFGQYPWLPDENGNDYASHEDFATRCDNYSVTGPIGSIRYWGFSRFCDAVPEQFVITFTDGAATQTYNVTTVGTVLPPVYYSMMNMHEYTVALNPPCTIQSGTVSVVKVNDPNCIFAWATSEFGDNYGPCNGVDYAFCLSEPIICEQADSLTIRFEGGSTFTIEWWQPEAGTTTVYYTTDPNAVYPAGYVSYGSSNFGVGHHSQALFSSLSYMNVVLVVNCPQAIAAPPSEPHVKFNE